MQKINADGTTEVAKNIKQDNSDKASTRQLDTSGVKRDEKGRFTEGNVPIAGFHTGHGQRSDGKWKKENSVSYQYNRMLAMTPEEFKKFEPTTNAEAIAKRRIERAIRDDDESLKETKEITDRTEGRAKQDISIEADEKAAPLIRGFVIPTLPEGYIDEQIAKARTNNE